MTQQNKKPFNNNSDDKCGKKSACIDSPDCAFHNYRAPACNREFGENHPECKRNRESDIRTEKASGSGGKHQDQIKDAA